MPDDGGIPNIWLVTMTILLVIVATVTLILLMRAWRRHDARRRTKTHRESMPDIWQAGGDRLIARLEEQGLDEQSDNDESQEDEQR